MSFPGGSDKNISTFYLEQYHLRKSKISHGHFSYKFKFSSTISLFLCKDLLWRRQWQPTPVLLPGKSHGRKSLLGYNPWGCEESGTTEQLHFHFSLSYIGEGNGNPLQCSCVENPRDGGAW